MIKTIIIDDEPLARSIVREYLQSHPEVDVITECSDGFEGVKAINQYKPDLIFLDIQMPKITGFEMLELIEEPPAVIFTTAFDEYAMKAFENSATDYLLKPYSKERFEKALGKFAGAKVGSVSTIDTLLETAAVSSQQSQRIVVKTGGKIKIIPVNEILFIEAADDYVKIITPAGSFLKNKTMAYFEKVLANHQFVRTHRSYILNVTQLTRLEPYEKEGHLAILKSGGHIPVSKSGYARLKEVLGI